MAATSILTTPWVPTPTDGVSDETDTLGSQLYTEHLISTLLTTQSPTQPPVLQKSLHTSYLTDILIRPLPFYFTALDASRPWLLYWTLHSFALLEAELDPKSKKRVIDTLASFQNPEGGFGGGPGQQSHLAPSYAAVCAVACVGADGFAMINRKGMYDFLLSLKQPDGSFIMHDGGEVDVRGTYCALVVATLLNLLTPELVANTQAFIVSCQTFEGGLASSAFPTDPSSSASPSPPLGEAHGGYAFCAAASYAMLLPFASESSTEPKLDLESLLRWATAMQANPIEGGGFRGRTNKLVDGCYSWWGGGLFGVLGALLDGEVDDVAEGLFDRVALQEYILYVAQDLQRGGLRDKPEKPADAYHTCYNLSGLSAAQHPQLPAVESARGRWKEVKVVEEGLESFDVGEGENNDRMKEAWIRASGWKQGKQVLVGGEENELAPTHALFNVTVANAQRMLDYFYSQR